MCVCVCVCVTEYVWERVSEKQRARAHERVREWVCAHLCACTFVRAIKRDSYVCFVIRFVRVFCRHQFTCVTLLIRWWAAVHSYMTYLHGKVLEKSPRFTYTALNSTTTAPISIKRTLHSNKRAPHCIKRSPDPMKTALNSIKRALDSMPSEEH